jgi:hypothetical protein
VIGIVDTDVSKQRYEICSTCEHFNKLTKQCKQCSCFMFVKVTLSNAFCPVGKWKQSPKKKDS